MYLTLHPISRCAHKGIHIKRHAKIWVALIGLLITAQVAASDVPTTLPKFAAVGLAENAAIDLDAGPDFEGLRRDTYYFLGYQFAAIGLLYVMPEGVSGWDGEARDEYSISSWKDNVTDIQWDSDDYFINYALHPYWGAAYYIRGRQRGLTRSGAFWFSTLLSTVYEMGLEALFEEPSIQDLIVTPVGGLLMGDYFLRLRDSISNRALATGKLTRKDKVLLSLTDPLGSLNRKADRIFGRDTQVTVDTYIQTRPLLDSTQAWQQHGTRAAASTQPNLGPKVAFGIRLQLRF
ncbi:MAG: DUF3943 domain-containing protein [Gammaproteobacteria bacterium]|nr:DUF3943 domain-containing protein [Gammaproteobacteria bacterium]